MIAQAEAFSRQVPLVYLVVMVNAVALAITHYDYAPWPQTVGAVALLGVASAIRTVGWWRSRDLAMDADRAANLLGRSVVLAVALGAAFSAWALSLYAYGDAYARAQVAFYLAVTGITVASCLMQLRAAALIVCAFALGPLAAFLWFAGEPAFRAISVNLAIVAMAMAFIMFKHYREFAALVESRGAISLQAAEAERLSQENSRLAGIDSLTQLPNRRNFFSTLNERLTEARLSGRSLVIGLIDLDGFKPVNDAFGHAAGDRLLIEVGQRLTALPGYPRFVARLGGDEFGIIISEAVTNDDLQAFGDRLCQELRRPFDLTGVSAQISGSIGFCTFPYLGTTAEQLFERADYALYHGKQNMSGAAVIFNDSHGAEIRELVRVEQALRSADLDAELSVAFQPIMDIAKGGTAGFEALARWTSPTLGRVPPNVFIRAAERSGQIGQVTLTLVGKALRAVVDWPRHLRLAINLSARDIASMETIGRITRLVTEVGVDPQRIDFEITETAILSDLDQARRALLALRATGAHIALDDFGTGHSSLSHVRLLPIDQLKVDASFVADIGRHQPSEDIVRAVIDLSRNLRLECVVEGVETRDQLERVQQLGGARAQGYHFARPMPATEIARYLNQETLVAVGRCVILPERGPRAAAAGR
ncbi:MAG: EAL domain-containing protein [Bauldia sp.]